MPSSLLNGLGVIFTQQYENGTSAAQLQNISNDTYIGYQAELANTTGTNNIFIGSSPTYVNSASAWTLYKQVYNGQWNVIPIKKRKLVLRLP